MSERVESTTDATLAELVRRLTEAYHPDRVYLFGSRARGEAGPDSDYDILLVVPDNAPAESRRARLAYRALRGTGVAADVVVWTRTAFEERLRIPASLPATVVREGKALVGA
jgi:predicted nucleotidyltransferase